jgi:hypothetical protein
VPSTIGSVYSRPVRLSVIVSVSSATARSPFLESDRDRLRGAGAAAPIGEMIDSIV